MVHGLVVSLSALYLSIGDGMRARGTTCARTLSTPYAPVGGDHVVHNRVEVWILSLFLEPGAVPNETVVA